MPVAGIVDISAFARDLVQRPLETVVSRHEYALIISTRIHDFHDVDLTTRSPCAVSQVCGHHPYS